MVKAPVAPRNSAARPTNRIRPRAIKARPELRAFTPIPNPLGKPGKHVDGELEKEAAEELTEVQAALQDSRNKEQKAFLDAVATDYYAVLVFDDGDQLTKFLTAVGIRDVGAIYIDGREMADKLGIFIEESQVEKKVSFRAPTKRMLDLTE